MKHGWQFINEFFIEHHFKRYLTNTYGHPQPFYFFTIIAMAGVLPWLSRMSPTRRGIVFAHSALDGLLVLLSLAHLFVGVAGVVFYESLPAWALFGLFAASILPGSSAPPHTPQCSASGLTADPQCGQTIMRRAYHAEVAGRPEFE